MTAAIRGYRMIFVMPDKMSQEKISLLRAFGAEVVVCPTAVEPESPESYYSVSDRLAEEIPGAFKPDQYSNAANPKAHYDTTGPEIWEQTDGELDALVVAVGTGGTISGSARFLKEQKPDLRVVGADPEGSIYSSTRSTRTSSRDRRGLLAADLRPRPGRRVRHGLGPRLVHGRPADGARGGHPGGRLGGDGDPRRPRGRAPDAAGADGRHARPRRRAAYLSKFLNDNYMIEYGFLEREAPAPTVDEVLLAKHSGEVPELVTIASHHKVGEAISLMQRYSISQLPVVRTQPAESLSDIVGSLRERGLLDRVFKNPDALNDEVSQAMQPPLAAVDAADTLDRVFSDLSGGEPGGGRRRAADGRPGMLTRSDLLEYLARARNGS